MGSIVDKSIEELAGISYHCACGQTHNVAIQKIILEQDAIRQVYDLAHELNLGQNALLIADDHTYRVAGEPLYEDLREKGMPVHLSVYHEDYLYPDERALGKVLIDVEPDTDVIIAVGAGTINDIARFVSFKMGIPYIVVATAPSMDGYASTGSPVMVEGFKKTYAAVSPVAIIGDLNILAEAPRDMIAAGFGDIVAKITALCDWRLASVVEAEHYCETISDMMVRALKHCVHHIDGLKSRDAQSVKYLMEGLILSGIAMQMMGNSRPASGSEHHLSHYWEMRNFAEGRGTALHGIKVGVATPLMMSMYCKLLREDIASLRMREKTSVQNLKWEQGVCKGYGSLSEAVIKANRNLFLSQSDLDVRYGRLTEQWDDVKQAIATLLDLTSDVKQLLRELDAPVTPEQIGIDRARTLDALQYAKEVRNRYTILQLADQLGLLESYAEEIAAQSAQVTDQKIYWQAHRGGGAHEAPENTMAANQYTWDLGGIPEADIRTTKDGVIVCHHDKTPKRTINVPDALKDVPISSFTLAEIRQWDAGVKFHEHFSGERIPSLDEVFSAMQRHPERLLYLDLKEVDLHQLGQLIDQYGVNRQIIFTHSRQENCIKMKEIAPGVRSMLWIGGKSRDIKQKFHIALDTGFEGLDQVQIHLKHKSGQEMWPYEMDREFLQFALSKTREAGVDLEVLPFQLEAQAIHKVLDLGIRWFATDEPSKLLQCIETWSKPE